MTIVSVDVVIIVVGLVTRTKPADPVVETVACCVCVMIERKQMENRLLWWGAPTIVEHRGANLCLCVREKAHNRSKKKSSIEGGGPPSRKLPEPPPYSQSLADGHRSHSIKRVPPFRVEATRQVDMDMHMEDLWPKQATITNKHHSLYIYCMLCVR